MPVGWELSGSERGVDALFPLSEARQARSSSTVPRGALSDAFESAAVTNSRVRVGLFIQVGRVHRRPPASPTSPRRTRLPRSESKRNLPLVFCCLCAPAAQPEVAPCRGATRRAARRPRRRAGADPRGDLVLADRRRRPEGRPLRVVHDGGGHRHRRRPAGDDLGGDRRHGARHRRPGQGARRRVPVPRDDRRRPDPGRPRRPEGPEADALRAPVGDDRLRQRAGDPDLPGAGALHPRGRRPRAAADRRRAGDHLHRAAHRARDPVAAGRDRAADRRRRRRRHRPARTSATRASSRAPCRCSASRRCRSRWRRC